MKWLLDVSALVALLMRTHVNHSKVRTWSQGKALVLCPITELGFLRVSTGPAHGATMGDARRSLDHFIKHEKPGFIPADTRALDGAVAPTSWKITDWYLANLAQAHNMKLATLDGGINLPNVDVI